MEEYFNYIKNPIVIKQEKFNWFLFFKLFIFSFIIDIGILGIGRFLSLLLDLPPVEKTFEITSLADFIGGGVIFAPILEELIFRLPLRMNKTNFAISGFLVLVIGIISTLKGTINWADSIFVLIFIFSLLCFLKKIPFKYFFYLSALLFGLAHLFNYTDANCFMLFFIIATIILSATIFGFLRIKYGIQYSILFHMLSNAFGILTFLH